MIKFTLSLWSSFNSSSTKLMSLSLKILRDKREVNMTSHRLCFLWFQRFSLFMVFN